jgi:hypothetical protein
MRTVQIGKSGRNAHVSVLAEALIGSGDPFRNSNGTFFGMRGQHNNTFAPGRLPAEWAAKFKSADRAYVAYSYGTPIAWLDNEGKWTVPAVNYSVTTFGHQGKLRAALAYNDKEYTESL